MSGPRWVSILLFILAVGGGVACRRSGPAKDPAIVREESIRLGDELVSTHKYPQAVAAYRAALKVRPDDGPVRLKLAKAYVLAHDTSAAGLEAAEAARLMPDNTEARLLVGTLSLARELYRDAAEAASAVLSREPENLDALNLLGNAKAGLIDSAVALTRLDDAGRKRGFSGLELFQVRKPVTPEDDRAAEAAFRKAVSLAPSNWTAQVALANFLWAAGRADESEELLKTLAAREPPDQGFVNRVLGGLYLSRHQEAEGEKYLKTSAIHRDGIAVFVLVDYYLRVKRDADALTVLEAMPIRADKTGDVTLRLAPLQFRAGKRDEAIRRLNDFIARKPDSAQAVVLKAQFLSQQGDWTEALRLARAAVVQYNSSEARLMLGQLLVASGDLENALAEFSEAFKLKPGEAQPKLEMARVFLTMGREQEALTFSGDALRQHPDDRDAAIVHERALVQTHDYFTAEMELKSLLARFPGSADLQALLGELNMARGNDEAASAAFTRAIALDRTSLDALSGLVSLDLKAHRAGVARQRIRDSLAAHPSDPAYLVLAARVYRADNDAAQAESALRQALNADRTNVKAALLLADVLAETRRADEARKLLEELVDHRPWSVEGQTALGVLMERMGQLKDAQVQYEKTVRENPRAAVASYKLAAIYADQDEKLNFALDLANAARKQLPDDPAVNDVLGWLYVRKKQPALGVPSLESAVHASPNNPVYRYHLGVAYARTGKPPQAREELTRALQIDKGFAFAAQARETLASIAK